MDRSIDVSSIEGLQAAILATGKVDDTIIGRGGVIVKGMMAGDCQNPIEIYRAGWSTGPSGKCELNTLSGSAGKLRKAVSVKLRCRQCTSCLRARGRYWRRAAMNEMAQSAIVGGRTWFGTLTLTPEYQAEATYRAMSAVGGPDVFWELSPQKQFAERHHAVQRQLTLALKRLRKEMGAGAFRYLLVCEAHKSGLPHYHMLIHECSATLSVRKSSLNDFWRLGFSQWRLAKPEAAAYVAKYLSKAALARVRASQRYGSWVHQTVSTTEQRDGNVPHAKATRGEAEPAASGVCLTNKEVKDVSSKTIRDAC